MTQQGLASRTGVDIRTIRRWERRETWPGPTDLQALAKALDVRVMELFNFPDSDL